MKSFLDTSVFVATFFQDQPGHARSMDLFLRCEKNEASCGAHSLAEVYSTLTGMPGIYRVGREEALLFLGNIRTRCNIVALTEEEYVKGVEWSAAAGIIGGGIYDALLAQCALKSGAETIYTLNVKHFIRLGPEIASRVATP